MRIEVFHNGTSVGSHDFGEGTYKIGRSPSCDIRLKSAQISKEHALLVIKGNKAAVVDLGSSNGVFVNGILIKKQRVEPGDDVVIVDFHLRIGAPPPPRRPGRASAAVGGAGPMDPMGAPLDTGFGGGYDGNLAMDMGAYAAPQAMAEEPEPETPQEKLLNLLDNKIMVPFYELLKGADWRWILAVILLTSLVASVLLSVIPIVRWGVSITTKEALGRAHSILAQAVRENYRILSKTRDYSRLTVEVAESEEGMLAVYIVDPKTKSILAPAKLFNKTLNDVWSLAAMEKVIKEKEDKASVQKDDITHVLAQPIYLFSAETNQQKLEAMVVAYFEVNSEITSTFEPMVEAALFAVLLSLAAFFFIYKMSVHPVQRMNEQLDAALKGDNVSITCEAKFPELQSLAEVMNFTVSRLKSENGGMPGNISQEDPEAEDAEYVKAVKTFDEGTSDALLLLTTDKRVRFVGHIMEDLINLRPQYAEGQNISDCCKDSGFAGTAIDLTDNVLGQLGATQYATLDINGIQREMVAIAHKNRAGEIRFILLVVQIQTTES